MEQALEEFANVLEEFANESNGFTDSVCQKMREAAVRIREVNDSWGYSDMDVIKYVWTGEYEK